MNKQKFLQFWRAFLQWKGWRAFGAWWVRAWKRTISWRGWKAAFCIPFWVVAMLSILCALGLIWVFTNGLEASVAAYCLYPLSFYSLVALCVKLPEGIRRGKAWVSRHPKAAAFFRSSDAKFTKKLYRGQIINFAYGSFKIGAGIYYGSAWIGCDGIYNLAQAMIQLFQILRRKNPGTIEKQWRSYRVCGVLILLMHLTLIGMVFQMVNWNRAEDSGEIMIITTAAFAFYKFTSAFIGLAKDRKHVRPVDSSVRMLKFSQAMFAMFSLQAGLLHTFGTGESWEHWMNLAMGCLVCMLTVAMGIYMIRRANREMKQLQENEYGA